MNLNKGIFKDYKIYKFNAWSKNKCKYRNKNIIKNGFIKVRVLMIYYTN